MEQGVHAFAKILTLIGSVILIGCVSYLTVGWWDDHRWTWVVIGVIIIVVNLAVIVVRLKPTPPPRDWSIAQVQEVIGSVHGEMAQIRTLRRADKGLTVVAAAELVSRARTEAPDSENPAS